MGTISRTYDFTNGSVADADQVDTDLNTIYNEFNGSIDNTNVAADAAIATSKLALSTGSDSNIDLNGKKLILDADGDTSITADTDDQIDFEIAGADDFQMTANTFTVLSGSKVDATAGAVDMGDSAVKLNTKVYAYLSATQGDLTDNTWTTVELDTESFDVGSDFNTGTYTFTAPTTGYYFISYNVTFGGTDLVADKYYAARVTVDGTAAMNTAIQASITGERISAVGSGVVKLTATNPVLLQALADSGTNTVDVVGSDPDESWLSIHLLSVD